MGQAGLGLTLRALDRLMPLAALTIVPAREVVGQLPTALARSADRASCHSLLPTTGGSLLN